MQYSLKVGKILSYRSADDIHENTFRVRVLPDMEDIAEENLLPNYPNFFNHEQIAHDPGDTVWVLCSSDFQVGFILGPAQPPAGASLSTVAVLIRELEKSVGLSETSAYDDLDIISAHPSYIQYHCRSTGRSGVIYNTAALYLVDTDGTTYYKNPSTFFKATATGEVVLQGLSLSEQVETKETIATTIKEQAQARISEISGVSKESIGGSAQRVVAGNSTENVVGDKQTLIAKKSKEVIGLGVDRKIVAGGVTETILLGDYKINIALGKMQIISGGGLEVISTAPIKIISPSIELVAPILKTLPLPATPTGTGPFCAIPFCLFTGAPQAGFAVGG